MENTPEKNQRIFSSIAKKYDRLNTLLTWNIDQKWRRKAISLLALNGGEHVLDVCCGTGKMIALLCQAVGKTTTVTGIDYNSAMLEVGRANLVSALPGYTYSLQQGDALALPFADNTFDHVTIAFGIRNVGKHSAVLEELYRVLKPGGHLVCLELSKPQNPILKVLFSFHLNHVMPVIGLLGTGDKEAYQFLKDSIHAFLTKEALKALFEATGYQEAGYISLTCCIAAIHYGRKAD